MIAGRTRDRARGSTAKTDGRSTLIPWLAIAAGGLGVGEAPAVCESDGLGVKVRGLAEAVALSIGDGDWLAVEVSEGETAVEVSEDGCSEAKLELFSSAKTGATMVTRRAATRRAPIRLAIKDGR